MHTRKILASLSIRKKLLLFLLVIVIPVLCFIIESGLHDRRHSIDTAKNNALLLAQSVAAQQEKVAVGTKQMLSTLAKLPMVQRLDADGCNKLFRELNQLNSSYSTISAVTPDGNMFASSLPFQPGTVNLADRKHIKDAITTTDFSAGEYIIGRNSNTPSLNYTYPVLDGNNKLIAIVIAGFKLDEYASVITKAKPPEGSAIIITDHRGTRLLRFPGNDATAQGKPIPKDSFERVSGDLDQGLFERVGEDGLRRIYAFKQLRLKENLPPYLYVLVGFANDKILQQADRAMLGNLSILGIIALVEICLVWVFGNYVFVRPINTLVTAAQRFGKGELSTRTDLPHTPDDLGLLAKSFDDMASRLEIRDTERLQAEEALQQREEQYRHLFEKQIDIYYRTDLVGKIIMVSPSVEKSLGYKPEDLIGSNITDLYALPEERDSFLAVIMKNGFAENYEIQMTRKNGSSVWMAANSRPDKDNVGRILGVEGVIRDITENKRMKEALQESEELYRLLVTEINDGFFKTDSQGILTFANDALAGIYGFDTPDDCIGKHIMDFVAPSARERAGQIFSEAVSGGKVPTSFEIPTLRINGEVVQTEVKPTVIFQQDGAVITQGLLIDISERKRAEDALRKNEERLDLALRATQDAIWDWDLVTNILYYSPHWWSMVGYEENELVADPDLYRRLMHPEDLERADHVVSEAIASEPSFEIETRLRHKEGHYVPVLSRGFILRDDTGKAVRVSGTNTDLTEHKKVEEERRQWERELQQLQKAESLNRMAGAIAHTFNNLLAVVMGNIELTMEDLPQTGEPFERLNAAMLATNKAAEVSGLMLTYLGQSVATHELLDLSSVCRNSLPMLTAIIKQGVSFETDLPSSGPAINASLYQINIVLQNLITNASESLADARGSIHLTVKTISLVDIPIAHRFPIDWESKNNTFACIEVQDTGCGIAEKDIEMLFDPFFSNKFTGRGLGLPVVLGIMRAHHGVVVVESEPDRGSVFQVFFPLSVEQVPLSPSKELHHAEMEAGGAVLVVDDEEQLREMAEGLLVHLGFTVLVAKDGIEAMEVYRQHQDEIRVVLCDLIMPRMNGWETLAALRELKPNIPIILASGYDKAQVMQGEHVERPQAFLQKPFRLQALKIALGAALTPFH